MQQIEAQTDLITVGHPITKPLTQSAHPELSHWLSLVAKNQDKDAFTKLFGFFAPKIKRFGIKQFNNESQATELVQDTMTNVWKKAHLYDASKGAATTWVYTVMRNACFDYLRKVKNHPQQNIGDDIWPLEQALDENSDQVSPFQDHLMTKRLQQFVDTLPTAQKVVVQGVYYQELSQEQLSQQLGVPIGTIKSRLRLALEKIRQQMGDHDHD
ncbi:sigma-70 family RNA polymerase sigma factor [Vibrio sp. TH_r3]|uniref:sigma-70 family RNA polymerase sigma factor n=1 Tax=unclassified Vibrio TaxID=2614977 RepID=UPI002955B300|nr:sigma-70 family RNA polymerase sigma factor [Vibrio sp. TH_r3]MDV7104899.1 sigma-70 family RNA polymerase sigma factor [Vibrio sp. TH_r3]